MYTGHNFSEKVIELAAQAELDCKEVFAKLEANCMKCSAKVLAAFRDCRVSTTDFLEVTGYGYTDDGRD